jgi:hypothetical protein
VTFWDGNPVFTDPQSHRTRDGGAGLFGHVDYYLHIATREMARAVLAGKFLNCELSKTVAKKTQPLLHFGPELPRWGPKLTVALSPKFRVTQSAQNGTAVRLSKLSMQSIEVVNAVPTFGRERRDVPGSAGHWGKRTVPRLLGLCFAPLTLRPRLASVAAV